MYQRNNLRQVNRPPRTRGRHFDLKRYLITFTIKSWVIKLRLCGLLTF